MFDGKPARKLWKPADLEALLNHDAVTVPVDSLPLDAIAEFCRKWGIKEMYSMPMELEWFEPGGPFDGTEVSMRVTYRDDTPAKMEKWGMGRLITPVIGKKTFATHLPSPGDHGFDWRSELILERKMPIYAE